jgi:glyoxylase-like metal-dependent hydrolase (beta-lactamase superfamily II)
MSNAGLIAGDGESVLVDTLFDLRLTQEMLDGMAEVTADRPITHAVNTHANGDHCYGNQLLPDTARIHATKEAVAEMNEMPPEVARLMVTQDLGPVLTPYLRGLAGQFDFDGITLREPDVTIGADSALVVGERELELLCLGPAHTSGDVVVHVPDAATLFAGDLLFIENTPIMWAGPVENWIAACDTMLALEPEVVVPGHGPVAGAEGIQATLGYLTHVNDQAKMAFGEGKPWRQAAFEIDLDRYAALRESERVVANVYGIYRGLDPGLAGLSALELFTAMALWRRDRDGG